MPDKDIYAHSFSYENLMIIAFNCTRGTRHGAHLCFMQNAMTMEQGKNYAKHLGSFDKQFDKVKNYISKALLKLSKTKPFNIESSFFVNLDYELNQTETTSELMIIVNLALRKALELNN